MNKFAKAIRAFAKWQFRIRGLSTISEIPTEEFPTVLSQLKSQGWITIWKSLGLDPDHDCLRMWRKGRTIKCEWDIWDEWSIAGKTNVVRDIAENIGREHKAEWRWAVWDDKPRAASD